MYAKVTIFKNFVIFMFFNSSIDNKKQIIVNIYMCICWTNIVKFYKMHSAYIKIVSLLFIRETLVP
jgi:hypothetical protein